MRSIGCAGPINEISRNAESVLSRGYAAKQGVADGGVTAVTAAGQRAVGIVTADVPAIGRPAPIVRAGDAIAIAGAAFPAGSYVKVDATGRVIAVVGTVGDGEEILGRAESTATAAGDEVVVFVLPSVL